MQSLSEFISLLRHYKKADIVNIGSTLLWGFFRNKRNYTVDKAQVINSYAPKLIILALATANEYRSSELNEIIFYNLCGDFLSIKDPLSDKEFMDEESHKIFEYLKNKNGKEKKISDNYLDQKIIKNVCSYFFISRLARQQYETFLSGLNEFYMVYDILIRLNKNTNGLLEREFKNIFEVKPLHFLRAIFGIFTLGNNKNGMILFQELTCEQAIKNKLEIDIDACKSAALKISYSEDSLREHWYKNEVLNQPELYQKYYPTPLYKYPIISMDSTKRVDCFVPSPRLYIRGVIDGIFDKIRANDKDRSFDVGSAIEAHIFDGLKEMFGEERVCKISEPNKSRSADFYVDFQNCSIVIECKSSMGAYTDLSIMSPKNIADIWSRLYSACEQCSATIKSLKKNSKPIIPIVLIASHITAEAIPFQSYAFRSNIFRDMEIEHIEFISWNFLQYVLSKSSVEKFVTKMLERKSNHSPTMHDILSFELEKDEPAYKYEFLKESEYDIFGKNFN